MNQKTTFGSELRQLRKKAGASLADTADAAGCSIVHMSDVERDKKNPPSPQKIEKILQRLESEEELPRMLVLAVRARQSVEISVAHAAEDVTSMLVALARRCDEGELDADTVRQIQELLERRRGK